MGISLGGGDTHLGVQMGVIFCDCALIFLCHLPYLPGGFLAVSGECLEKGGFGFLGGSLAVPWRFPGGFLAVSWRLKWAPPFWG